MKLQTRSNKRDIEKSYKLIEEQYNDTIEDLPEAVYTCDNEGHVIFYNRAAVKLWGREPIAGDLWCGSWKIYRTDGTPLPFDECPMALCYKEGKRIDGEEIIVERPDGSRRHVIAHPTPTVDADSRITGAVNILVDITEKYKLEQQAKQSEEFYKTLVEKSNDVIVLTNAEGIISYCSPSFTKLSGFYKKDYLHKNIADFIHTDDVKNIKEQINAILSTPGEAMQVQMKCWNKKGTYNWCEGTVTNLLDRQGINALVFNYRNISERKKAEEQTAMRTTIFEKSTAAASDNMLHHLAFENSLFANIISAFQGGKIISANIAACKLLGYSKKELLTKNTADIFDINESSFKKMLKQITAKGHSAAMVNVVQKSGKTLPCQVTSAVFMDEDNIEKSITTIADMSQSILKQKNIDAKKEKIISDNIALAISDQKTIDTLKEKIVAENIALAIAKQKNIDTKKEKIVADNIVSALSKQIDIDARNKKIVAENIALAIAKQIEIDVQNEKIVAENIMLALSKQIDIDDKNKKIVADNIALTISKQIEIDVKNEKIVADNISLAKSKQKNIDNKKEKIVADNIVSALSKQIDIDAENKKIVAENIALAIAKQIEIDVKNEKIVAENIALAISNQKNIDVRNEKIVADNIVLAISKQTEIDTKKEKIVADNIMIAQAKSDARLSENNEEQNEKFLMAARLSSDVIWDWNLLTDELLIGEGFEELFGYSLKNNKGNLADWSNRFHPDDKEAVEKGLYDAIASSAANWEYAYRFIRADGSIAKVFNRASIFRQADGKAYRMIGALQDITERIRTEQEKELIIKELMKSNADLKQFSYITSHNLRAPLSNIQSILNIIDYSTLDTANAEMLKMLNTSGKQLTKTIEDLTKILVIKNNANAEIRTISLTDAFIELNNIFSSALEEAGAKVFTDFRDPDIDFNETYFESILINLFSNAIKYRSPDRSLVIHASSENDNNGNTIFSFSDNGSGIDTNRHKDKLFGLYQRFHETIEGHGLGLYIIKSQIEALGSTIEIESELDKGTTFIITFKKQSFEKERE